MACRLKHILLMLTFLISTLISQDNSRNRINQNNLHYLTNEDYITGEDGVIRMNVNVWEKNSNIQARILFMIILILSLRCLLLVAHLGVRSYQKISIISKNGDKKIVNLKELIEKNNIQSIGLKPNDTIYIEESLTYSLTSNSNFINTFLQFINLFYIISN